MAIDLATLLQSVPGIAEAPAPPANWQEQIDPSVLRPVAGPQVTPEPSNVSSVSQDIQGTEDTVKALEKFQHKGLFGVKGTLRDVLGILGDSLTGRMTYSTARRDERYGDILAGKYVNNEEENFINNPLLAIQRLGEEGFGQEAAALYQDYVKNEQAKQAAALNEARLGSQELRNAQLAKQGDIAAQDKAINVISRLITGARSQQELDALRGPAEAYLRRAGLVDPDTGQLVSPLPTKYGEGSRTWGIQPYQAERLEDFDAGLGIQQQNANSNSQRAATARPRADSRAEIIERIGNKPPEKRTPGEQAAYENAISTGRGNTRGRRTGGGGATSSGGAPSAPPRKKGDAYRTSDGRIWRSPDGKSWQ